MSGNNIARKVRRSLLKRGKINEQEYLRFSRSQPISLRAEKHNDKLKIWAEAITKFRLDFGEGQINQSTRHKLAQAYFREAKYHPTKGFRYSRGEKV